MTDWFFDLIANKLPVIEDMLKKYSNITSVPSWIEKTKRMWWVEKNISTDVDDVEIAAIDGGGGYADLLGGGGFYIARAVAVYSSRSNPSRELLVDIVKYRARGYLDVIRMLTEIKVARRAVRSLSSNSVLLMDGSLYVMVNYLFTKFFKVVSKPDRISLGEFYLLERLLETMIELSDLMEETRRKNILLAFVSKDSNLRVLKEHLAYMFFNEKYPKLAELMKKYPIGNRRIFLRIYKESDDPELKSILSLILDTSYRDIQLITDLVGSNKGYSKPLLLGALTEPVRRLQDSNYVKQLLSDTISIYPFREKQDEFNKRVEYFNNRVGLLRTPILLYVKVSENEPPLMVEIPSQDNIIETIGTRRFTNEDYYVDKTIGILYRDYKGRRYYNIWLVYAHNYAKLSRKQFLYYIKYIEALLSKKHIRIPFTRRYSMEA